MRLPSSPLLRATALLLTAVVTSAMPGWSRPAPAASGPLWFDRIDATPPTDEAVRALTRRLASHWFTGDDRLLETASLGTRRIESPSTRSRIVFVSISDGNSAAHIGLGGGSDLETAALTASQRIVPPPNFEATWIRVDVAYDVRPLATDETGAALAFDPGRRGLALAADTGLAWLPEATVGQRLVDPEGLIDQARLPPGVTLDAPSNLSSFRTVHGFATRGGALHVRGDGPPPTVRLQTLELAAARAGAYLVDTVRPDGRFDYSRLSDRPPTDYNILRHSGTLWAMLDLFEHSPDRDLLAATERALGYLAAQVETCKLALDEHRCVVENGEVKLGGNALALVALARHAQLTGNLEKLPLMTDLARWIRAVQSPRGRFAIHLQTWPGGGVRPFSSSYYSGQAILALVEFHRLTGDPQLLDAALHAARYLLEEAPSDQLTAATVSHWELIALDVLLEARPEADLVTRGRELGILLLGSQHREGEPQSLVGGFGDPPRGSAPFLEALAAAHRLLKRTGHPADAEPFLAGLRLGIAHQLTTQYGPEAALFVDPPELALGGFRLSPDRREIRIDHVQHNLSAILGLARLLRDVAPVAQVP